MAGGGGGEKELGGVVRLLLVQKTEEPGSKDARKGWSKK